MPQLTDPMIALRSLEPAIRRREVTLRQCENHPELQVLIDRPDGVNLRITYAKLGATGVVQGIAILTPVDPIEGIVTFQIAYAVAEPFRGRGLASELVIKAIDEFQNGMARNNLQRFYVEAIVGQNNAASNAVARKTLSDHPTEGTDDISGVPIFAYVKLVGASDAE